MYNSIVPDYAPGPQKGTPISLIVHSRADSEPPNLVPKHLQKSNGQRALVWRAGAELTPPSAINISESLSIHRGEAIVEVLDPIPAFAEFPGIGSRHFAEKEWGCGNIYSGGRRVHVMTPTPSTSVDFPRSSAPQPTACSGDCFAILWAATA